MKKHNENRSVLRARLHRTIVAAAVGMLCVGLLAGPASAATTGQEPVTNAERQINAFLQEYWVAVDGSTGNQHKIRAKYLSPELDKQLDQWAQQNHADPIFRAPQGVPVSWTTKYQGSGMGISRVTVTEQWGGGRQIDVQYSVRLDNQLIVDLYS